LQPNCTCETKATEPAYGPSRQHASMKSHLPRRTICLHQHSSLLAQMMMSINTTFTQLTYCCHNYSNACQPAWKQPGRIRIRIIQTAQGDFKPKQHPYKDRSPCIARTSLAGRNCPVLLTGTFGCAIWRSAGSSSQVQVHTKTGTTTLFCAATPSPITTQYYLPRTRSHRQELPCLTGAFGCAIRRSAGRLS
jgi:hypothetical protein